MIENLITGEKYIGQSQNIPKRFDKHMKSSSNPGLKSDVLKYGVENFSLTILKTCSIEDLSTLEEEFVQNEKPQYNRLNHFSTVHITEEAKLNMKKSALKRTKRDKDKLDDFIKSGETQRYKKRKILAKEIESDSVTIFESLYEASKITGVPRPSIHQILNGKRKQSKGYVFEYIN